MCRFNRERDLVVRERGEPTARVGLHVAKMATHDMYKQEVELVWDR